MSGVNEKPLHKLLSELCDEITNISKEVIRDNFPRLNDGRVEVLSERIEREVEDKFVDIINTTEEKRIEEKIEEIKQLKESSPDCDTWRPSGIADVNQNQIEFAALQKHKQFMLQKLSCLKQKNDRLKAIINSKRDEIGQQIEQIEVVCPSLDV